MVGSKVTVSEVDPAAGTTASSMPVSRVKCASSPAVMLTPLTVRSPVPTLSIVTTTGVPAASTSTVSAMS